MTARDWICPVCFDGLADGCVPVVADGCLRIAHMLCLACANRLLAGHPACPKCREPFASVRVLVDLVDAPESLVVARRVAPASDVHRLEIIWASRAIVALCIVAVVLTVAAVGTMLHHRDPFVCFAAGCAATGLVGWLFVIR